jgi:hypothetical protein
MTLDLRKDAKAFRKLLAERVDAYAKKVKRSPNLPPVSAIEVGYQFDQAGWIYLHFDVRPKHDRDGQWTLFKQKDLFPRPDWYKAVEALSDGKPPTIILTDGTRRPGKLSEKAFAAMFGKMIKDVLLQAKKEGLFAPLPCHNRCQIDIEEFNGNWAWPAYDKLGKTNLV